MREPPGHPPQPMSAHCAATSVGWRDSLRPDASPCRATGSCGKFVQTASLLEDLDGGPQGPGRPHSGPLSLRRLAAPACRRPAWQRQPSEAGGSQMMPGSSDGPDPQPGILRWCPALGWCQCPAIPIATPQLILGRRCRNSCVRMQTCRTALRVGSNTPIRRHSLLEVAGRTLTDFQDCCQLRASGRRVVGARARISNAGRIG